MGNNNESVGGYAEARHPNKAIDFVTRDRDFLKRHPYPTVGLFGQGWDDLKTLDNRFPAVAKRRTTRDQKVIVSNEEDFFRAFERRHGGDLPVLTEAYGNEWDVLSASMAEQTSWVRRSVERLRTAEAIAAIVNRHQPDFWRRRKAARDLTHLNLGLYWEHDWTSDASDMMRKKRAAWQKRLADQISHYVDKLLFEAEAKLASLVAKNQDLASSTQAFIVFNPLGWQRDAAVLIEGHFPTDVEIVDAQSNVKVVHHRVGDRQIMVQVNHIPPVGYVTLLIHRANDRSASVASAEIVSQPNVIENSDFKIVVGACGEVTSVFDKKSQRELVGAGGFNTLMQDGKAVVSNATVATEGRGELGQRLKIIHSAPIKSQTVIALTTGDGIRIENTILQNFSQTLTWSFDFDVDVFQLQHEEVGAIVTADLVSKGGHYADRNARYDWLSAGHFVRITEVTKGAENKGAENNDRSEPNVIIDIANHDCSFFQFGQSTARKLDTSQPRVQFLIGGQVDGPELGIGSQNGDTLFTQRFSVRTSHGSRNGEVSLKPSPMAWALEQTNLPVSIQLPQNTNGVLPSRFSLLKTEPLNPKSRGDSNVFSNVLLWSLKPAESGAASDIIARWWNVTDLEQSVVLSVGPLQAVEATSHIETNFRQRQIVSSDGSGKFVLPFSRQQMRTFRLKCKE